MVKVTAGRIDGFLARPDAGISAVLFYGPDAGLIRERALALTRSVVGDPKDPFRVAEVSASDLKGDPARLSDEISAISMTGGQRVVRVRNATDAISTILSTAFAELPARTPGSTLVAVEAGSLAPKSSLRKLFESSSWGAALPCYNDEARTLTDVIQDFVAKRGFSISRDALSYLQDNLGGDRLVTRMELEKLTLYAANAEHGKEIQLEDALACVGDSALLEVEDAIYAAAEGNFRALDQGLARIFLEGGSPVAVLRAAQRHMQRLHFVAGAIAQGEDAGRALQALRPPLFFKRKSRFSAQLRLWPLGRLRRVMRALIDAEITCKQTNAAAESIAQRALMSMAFAATSGR